MRERHGLCVPPPGARRQRNADWEPARIDSEADGGCASGEPEGAEGDHEGDHEGGIAGIAGAAPGSPGAGGNAAGGSAASDADGDAIAATRSPAPVKRVSAPTITPNALADAHSGTVSTPVNGSSGVQSVDDASAIIAVPATESTAPPTYANGLARGAHPPAESDTLVTIATIDTIDTIDFIRMPDP